MPKVPVQFVEAKLCEDPAGPLGPFSKRRDLPPETIKQLNARASRISRRYCVVDTRIQRITQRLGNASARAF